MRELMEKYRDLPMDLADAALVRVAEREGLSLPDGSLRVARTRRGGRAACRLSVSAPCPVGDS
jgi:hypothetical protein